KPGSRTVEWRGRADGTYSIRTPTSGGDIEPGTHDYLACKEGSEQYFEPDTVRDLAYRYGSLLPYPIRFTEAGIDTTTINEDEPPWKQDFLTPELEREAYLEYGRAIFGTDFLDYVPLRSNVGDVRGAAFVLPDALSLAARKTHRVYLKNMLLSESAEGLLPEWAFFVKCIVNANDLRPTASRESFYEDDALAATRESLGRALRNYLLDLAEKDPTRLKRLIALHMLSIKALASADEEFFRIFVKWLPFETNMGVMTLTELREAHGGGDVVRFATDSDVFRQIARVAAAQSLCVVNAGYTYDAGLLLKFRETFPGARLERVDGDSLSYSFDRLTLDEQDEVAAFLSFAEGILRPFNCAVEVRKFSPGDLPALYTAGDEANFRRAVETTKEVTDAFWSSVLDRIGDGREGGDDAAETGRLCFNYRNPVVYKICRMSDETLQRLSVQVLYAQSLLLGHRPLSAKEMKLLNDGLLGLVEWGADIIFEGGVQ
ncbi:MAG: HSP90 family protein, partial [Rubrivivax sp.]|nr:HSP90 family protein [Pyrinomonadaceae bacterium]